MPNTVRLGAAAALAAWGVAGWLRINHLPTPRRGPDPTAGAVDLTLALVLVALGLRSLAHRHDPPPMPTTATTAPSASPHLAAAFGLGVVAMASNVTSVVLFLPAVRDIARSSVTTPGTILALVVLFTITLAPALLPVLAVSLGGAPGRRALDRVGAFAQGHHETIVAVVSFGFAVYLGWTGLRRL